MAARRGPRRPGRPRPRQAYDVEGTAVDSRARRADSPSHRARRRDRRTSCEQARTPTGPAFADAVTFAFGDAEAQLYGLARIGLSPASEDGGARTGSALAVLFAGREPVAAIARGGLEVGRRTRAGTRSRSAACDDGRGAAARVARDDGRRAARLRPALRGALAARRDRRRRPVAAGGRDGRLRAAVRRDRHGARRRREPIEVRCLGQRGHGWGEPDWEPHRVRAHASRPGPDAGYGARALERAPAAAPRTREEPVWAALLDDAGHAARRRPAPVDDLRRRRPPAPRRPRAVARRRRVPAAAARARSCAARRSTSAQLRLDCAFFRWRIEGETGVGRYDVLRRA